MNPRSVILALCASFAMIATPLCLSLSCKTQAKQIQPLLEMADVPAEVRTKNWKRTSRSGGSCVHASTVTMLRWHGWKDIADWWRNNYSGGQIPLDQIEELEKSNLRYAYVTDGDVEFLKWASRNRLVAGITYYDSHFVNLVHYDQNAVVLLDNNTADQYDYVSTDVFDWNWKYNYGGFAFVLYYDPPPGNPTWETKP